MTWAKLDDTFHHHPKVLSVSLSAKGLFALSLSYATDNLTDGFVPEKWVAMQLLEDDQTAPEQLKKAGLWTATDGGYRIHDYEVYNPTRADIEEKRKADAVRKRDSRRSPNGHQTDSARTPRAPGSGSGKGSTSVNPNGSEGRPTVNRKRVTDEEWELAGSILAAFNEIAGTGYTVAAHCRPIVMRLREHPELGLEEHQQTIAASFRDPWWKGHPGPQVVYGSAAVFEQALEKARRSAGRSSRWDRFLGGKAA